MAIVGKVISTTTGPTPQEFTFTISKDQRVRKDQFVMVKTEEGLLIGTVRNIRKTNRYYSNPDAVFDAKNLEGLFPIDEFEFLLGEVTSLGVISSEGLIKRPSLPPSPGDPVEEASESVLKKFLGLDDKGLNIGKLLHHNIDAKLNLTKLIQKHLAILAMSGAGKSYLTSVLLEELLKRPKELGRPAIILIDVHGEYVGFAEPLKGKDVPPNIEDFSDRAVRVVGMKIPVPQIPARFLANFVKMSPQQIRLLEKVKKKLPPIHTLEDVINAVRADPKAHQNTKIALESILMELNNTGLFGEKEIFYVKNEEDEVPRIMRFDELVKPGKLAIFDLSGFLSERKRQILVAYIAHRVFSARVRDEIPPTLLIVEEAHNFIPQDRGREEAPARSILEKISREGRKFFCSLCIISQRPVNLSTTVLSQCNTQIILRITNPNDLDQIGRSSEGISSTTLKSLTTLQVGEALVVGEAVRFPIFVKVRERRSYEKKGKTLEEAAIEWEKKVEEDKEEVSDAVSAFVGDEDEEEDLLYREEKGL